MSLGGIIQGIGGEAPFVEKGRQVRRQERREDTQDKLEKRRVDISEQGVHTRLAELQRRLQKDSEWKTVGSAKQMKDGTWAQMQFQPDSGETRFVPVPAPEGGEFDTAGEAATNKALAKFNAYKAAKDAGADQKTLDRIWPPIDRMHYMNTKSGIVGFNTNPNPNGPNATMTPFQGYPPGFGATTPGGNDQPLDDTDQSYIDKMAHNEMTLDMIKKIYAGKNEYKLPAMIGQAIQRGFDPNAQLSSTAGQQIASAQSQIDINKPLIELIDQLGLKDNNQIGYLAWARIKYGAGKNTPGGLADEIANLELTRVTSAANALKNSSRAWAALSLALKHTPDVQFDSPAQIRRKLETINQRLQAVINEQHQFGTKSGLPNRGPRIDMKGVTGTIELPGGKKQTLGPQGGGADDLPQPIAPVRTP